VNAIIRENVDAWAVLKCRPWMDMGVVSVVALQATSAIVEVILLLIFGGSIISYPLTACRWAVDGLSTGVRPAVYRS
jgi:hypothetical protein